MVTSNSRDEGREERGYVRTRYSPHLPPSHSRSFPPFVPLSLSQIHSLWNNLSTLYPQLVTLYVLTGTALLNAPAI